MDKFVLNFSIGPFELLEVIFEDNETRCSASVSKTRVGVSAMKTLTLTINGKTIDPIWFLDSLFQWQIILSQLYLLFSY